MEHYDKVQVWIFARTHANGSKPDDPKLTPCLLLQTNSARGGFWQPVTGAVEDFETGPNRLADAACRETIEETGFDISSTVASTGFQFDFDSRFGPATEHVFCGQIDQPSVPKLDSNEHQNYRWVAASEAPSLLKFPANLEGLKRAFAKTFQTNLLAILVAVFAVLFTTHAAVAAQDARVLQEGAPIRTSPNEGAEILELKKAGQTIRVSSESREGWFKTRTSDNKLGWIQQEHISPENFKSTYDYANLDRTQRDGRSRISAGYKRFSIKLGIGPELMYPQGLNDALEMSSFTMYRGTALMGQLGYFLDPEWRVVLRLERLTASRTVNSFKLDISSIPVHAGIEYDIASMGRFKVGMGLYLGLGLNHEIGIQALEQTQLPSTSSITGTTVSGILGFNSSYWFNNWLSVMGELGYRYSRSLSKYSVNNEFFGDSPAFERDGLLTELYLSETGPVIYIGAEFRI